MSDTEEPEQDKEMMNMFASVWVKVEVDDDSSSNCENVLDTEDVIETKKKKPTRKFKKTLKCPTCEYSTIYKNCLNLHLLSHTNTKPFSCEFCKYTTKYPTSLQRHLQIQHDLKKSDDGKQYTEFKCDQCPYTSNFKWNLKAHKRKHKPEKQFQCEHCTYATAYRHNYMKHSKVHNKLEVIYKCDKCPFVTKFEGHISRHLAKIHNEISDKANKCDYCDFSTKVRWRLNIHKRRSQQTDVIKCSYCEFETHYTCESKKHKFKHYSEIQNSKLHENTEAIPVIPEFEPTPIDPNASAHEKSNNYMLDPKCEVEWNNIQVIESTSKDRPFQCIMCKYTSRFKASVQRHFQRHHTGSQNRPYKCVNCDFSTKTKDQIALHNKRSQSELEMSCRECNFKTLFKCQFVMHQKCHYTHKCNECNYTCKHKYEIQKHYSMIHLGHGLKCRFCDYKATRKESLLCHETIHTGHKPFKCDLCDYKSVRKSLLDNHVKRYHSDVKRDAIIVEESKIQSLKISVGDNLNSQDVIQDIRDHNISIEELLNSQVAKDFANIINSSQNDAEIV